jgi:hypothetical protein
MSPELDWLKGKSLIKVENSEYSWSFNFEHCGYVMTETLWRLSDSERLVVASDDHGQLFGLEEPVDAAKRVMEVVGTKKIFDYSYSKIFSDLILYFEDKIELQFLNTSGGYESWRAEQDGVQIISMGGGKLAKCNLVGQKWIYDTNS